MRKCTWICSIVCKNVHQMHVTAHAKTRNKRAVSDVDATAKLKKGKIQLAKHGRKMKIRNHRKKRKTQLENKVFTFARYINISLPDLNLFKEPHTAYGVHCASWTLQCNIALTIVGRNTPSFFIAIIHFLSDESVCKLGFQSKNPHLRGVNVG